MVNVFFSYSHVDEALRNQLETHLALLKRQQIVSAWHDRRLLAGSDFDSGISENLEKADIILLLVSADFLASDYCYSREMARALERHKEGRAGVIPVILRACDWHKAPFGHLVAAPRDGKAVTSWPNHDEAFADVAREIRKAAEAIQGVQATTTKTPTTHSWGGAVQAPGDENVRRADVRSSNLRLKREFSQLERDRFLSDSFEFIARFFEGSLDELAARNLGVQGRFQRVDASRFSTVVYRDGKTVAACSIGIEGLGGRHVGNITFSYDASARGGSYNESLHVEDDKQSLYFKPLGMQSYGGEKQDHLSDQGAAEHLWALLLRPLQG